MSAVWTRWSVVDRYGYGACGARGSRLPAVVFEPALLQSGEAGGRALLQSGEAEMTTIVTVHEHAHTRLAPSES